MTYETVEKIPKSVQESLPKHGQEIWMNAFNEASTHNNDDVSSIKIAWASVKQEFIKTDNKWEPKASSDISFNYCAEVTDAKVVEAEGIKKAILNITVMNGEANQNGWRLTADKHNEILSDISGAPIKMQHAKSDWEIIGTGISGQQQDTDVIATIEITEPAAVQKFETGTWNAENMGVSPGLRAQKMVCSVCSETIKDNFHEHQKKQIYEGQKCVYDVVGAHLTEISLTSDPAYAPYAGAINNITLTASLDKLLDENQEASIQGEGNMGDPSNGPTAAELLAKKEAEAKKVEAEKVATAKLEAEKLEATKKAEAEKIAAKDTATQLAELKVKELEAAKKAEATAIEAAAEAQKLIEAQKKEIIAIEAKLIAQTRIERTAELEAKSFSKEIIASIVDKDYKAEEYKAEVDKVATIIASVEVPNGSSPIDVQAKKELTDNDTCKAEFGVDEKTLLAMVTDGVDSQIR